MKYGWRVQAGDEVIIDTGPCDSETEAMDRQLALLAELPEDVMNRDYGESLTLIGYTDPPSV